MTAKLADRVKETSTTTGTGTLDLDGAVSGFRTFVAGIGTTNACYYAIAHQTAAEWEVGIGTVTDATPDTLSRTTVLASSNAGSLVSFSAGTKDVFCTLAAGYPIDRTGIEPSDVIPDFSTWTWVNQSTSTLTQTGGAGSPAEMKVLHNSSLNWRVLYLAQPATPYSFVAKMDARYVLGNSGTYGIYFYDGTKLMGIEYLLQSLNTYTLRVEKITNVNTDGSTAATLSVNTSTTFYSRGIPSYFCLSNDGSSIYFRYSDDGTNWTTLFNESVGTYITPTRISWGGVAANATNDVFSKLSYYRLVASGTP